jgi:hypothetical protein
MTEYVHLWVEGGAPRRLRSSQATPLNSAFIANREIKGEALGSLAFLNPNSEVGRAEFLSNC